MIRIIACFLCLVSALIFFGDQAFALEVLPQSELSALKKTDDAKILQVITPYTLQLDNGRIVYLTGLEFPDYTPLGPGDFSLTAMRILRDMLTGEMVEVYQTAHKTRGRLNRMGHQIAHLKRKRDDVWVQGALLSLGLARVQTSARNYHMAPEMYALEGIARQAERGIWRDKTMRPIAHDETPAVIDTYQLVEGTVQSVAENNRRIYLNFGKNWRTDFTVSIAPEERRNFSKRGVDPKQWNHHRVRVRGWVESYNGPFIEIDHPEQLEILSKAAFQPLPDAKSKTTLEAERHITNRNDEPD